MRIAVVSLTGTPLSPTTPARARKLLRSGGALPKHNPEGIFYLQLTTATGTTVPHDTVVGIDPGKLYSGMAVQTPQATLWLGHLVLPFPVVKTAMKTRHHLRRFRRYRKTPQRPRRFAHRTKCKLPPSIRANRDLEWRVLQDLARIYPITHVVYEVVKARGTPSFSPVMVGQHQQMARIAAQWPLTARRGWETARLRKHLGLVKVTKKSEASPASHAVDGVALAASHWITWDHFATHHEQGFLWHGTVTLTDAPFSRLQRPTWFRRALHVQKPAKGGIRKRKGGTTTPWGFRKGDWVEATKAGRTIRGWVSGYTDTETKHLLSVADARWQRLGQYAVSQVRLLARSSRLLVTTAPTVALRSS